MMVLNHVAMITDHSVLDIQRYGYDELQATYLHITFKFIQDLSQFKFCRPKIVSLITSKFYIDDFPANVRNVLRMRIPFKRVGLSTFTFQSDKLPTTPRTLSFRDDKLSSSNSEKSYKRHTCRYGSQQGCKYVCHIFRSIGSWALKISMGPSSHGNDQVYWLLLSTVVHNIFAVV